MELPYRFVQDLAEKAAIPEDGTLSISLYQDEIVKVVLFAFSAGQELSEHTASMPATLHQVSGRAEWVLGGDRVDAVPGSWAHMDAHLPHSIRAIEPCAMLLTMHKAGKTAKG